MADWTKLEQYLERIPTDFQVPGGEILIKKDGEILFEKVFGDRLEEAHRNQDLYWLYSMSKVFTATAVMQLFEQGKLSLESRLIDFFPELTKIEKKDEKGQKLDISKVTVRSLLSMTGGLSYDMGGSAMTNIRNLSYSPSSDEVAMAIYQDAFFYESGTKFQYALCHDILSCVVEKVSGLPLDQYMKKYILDPLGITNMGFFADEEQKKKIIPQYRFRSMEEKPELVGNENQLIIHENFPSGGAGLFGNLKDYFKLAEALTYMGKSPNGYQVLKPETVDLMREDQLTGLGLGGQLQEHFQNHGLEGYSYALGVRTRIEDLGTSPVGEFGWDGAAGGYILIDPVNHVTMGYLQHVINMGPVYGEIHPTLRKLVYEQINQ